MKNIEKKSLHISGADLALSIERILGKLTVCLNQETESIIQNNRDAANNLHAEKIRLMEQYKTLSDRLDREKTTIGQFDPSVKSHLQTIFIDFQSALENNLIALKAGHNSVGRLVNRILTIARKTVMQDTLTNYNASGSLSNSGVGGYMVPTKLNETF